LWAKTTRANQVLHATSAAEQWLFEDEPEVTASKKRGYQQCVLPHSVADDTRLDLTAFSLLCYRVRQSPSWGMSREELLEHRCGWRSFHKAVKTLAETEYMKRSQTKKKGGRWYAHETLDLSKAQGVRDGYQTLDRCVKGMLLKTLGLLDYLNSWPPNFVVSPQRIANRFNLSVKTVRRLMDKLLEAGLAEERAVNGSSICGYVRRPHGQNGEATFGQNGKAIMGQNGETPLKGKDPSIDRPLTPSAFPSGNPSASLTKSSASATFCECAEEKGALSLKTKPKPQGKTRARQKEASTTPCKPERREWVAVLDADEEDVIERLRCNDINGFLHAKLFSRSEIAKLAASFAAGILASRRNPAGFALGTISRGRSRPKLKPQ
jgi:predicted transcriptional regulator